MGLSWGQQEAQRVAERVDQSVDLVLNPPLLRPIVEAKATTCCYAKSDKQWIADPQGVPWETFLTYGESTVYGEGSLAKLKEVSEAACCAPTCCEPEAILQSAPQPATAACCAR